jgi:cytochrome P450
MIETQTQQPLDIGSPSIYESGDPVRVWSAIRERPGLYWNPPSDERGGFWAATRYADAVRLYTNAEVFRSEGGMRLDSDPHALSAAAGRMLIVTDPPRHGRLRSVVLQMLARQIVDKRQESIDRTADHLVTEVMERGGECDFVTDIAAKLPVAVVSALLGVPRSDWDEMLRLTTTAFGNTDASVEDRQSAHTNIFLYYADLVVERRGQPRDDMVSLLANATVDGEPLSDDEVILNCDGLLTGGNETTRHATARGVEALAEHDAQWQRLRSGECELERATEEILRWTSPGLHVMRTALESYEFDEHTTIEAGDSVTIWNGAANRDEAAFPDAETFDLGRTPNRHLTFGHARHNCVGAALARLEVRALLKALLHRVEAIQLTAEPTRLRSNFMWGVTAMPVQLVPRSADRGSL